MMERLLKLFPLLAICSLAGCVSMPTGPSMMALPGNGRSFDEFRYDDYVCRQFAYEQAGGTPSRASVVSGVGSAAVDVGLGQRQARLWAAGRAPRSAPVRACWRVGWREQTQRGPGFYQPATLRYGLYAVHVCQRPSCTGSGTNSVQSGQSIFFRPVRTLGTFHAPSPPGRPQALPPRHTAASPGHSAASTPAVNRMQYWGSINGATLR